MFLVVFLPGIGFICFFCFPSALLVCSRVAVAIVDGWRSDRPAAGVVCSEGMDFHLCDFFFGPIGRRPA